VHHAWRDAGLYREPRRVGVHARAVVVPAGALQLVATLRSLTPSPMVARREAWPHARADIETSRRLAHAQSALQSLPDGLLLLGR